MLVSLYAQIAQIFKLISPTNRCDGNIKIKVNDEHAYALIVDLRVRFLRVCLRVAL